MLADGDRSTVSWDIDMRRWGRENWGGSGKKKERPDGSPACLLGGRGLMEMRS